MPKIQFKRGVESYLPKLAIGEPAFTLDSEKLFIGGANGNVEFPKKEDIDSLQEQVDSLEGGLSETNQRFDELELVDANAEVLAARGGETTLGNRLDKVSSDLAEITTKKADVSYVDTKIGNIVTKLVFKGSTTFASLPTSGMAAGDYWYVTDRTTNYAYNGTSWIDIGNALNIGDNTITPKQTTFISTSKNLFNKSSVYNQDQKLLPSSGSIYDNTGNTDNSDVYTTHPIPLKNGETLNTNIVVPTAYYTIYNLYDSNGNYLARVQNAVGDSANSNYLSVTPNNANCAYIRFSIRKSYQPTGFIDNLMMFKGSAITSSTPYEPYGKTKFNNGLELSDDMITKVNSLISTGDKSNPLSGKIALFNGDSICAGTSVGSGDPTYGQGWAGRIGNKNNMSWVNYGVSGGTVAYAVRDATAGTYWYCISRSIDTMQANADYIILEGGINDWGNSVPMGTITPNYTTAFDDTTFCGAFESMLKKAILKWKGKKIGFVIPHKMFGTYQPYGPYSTSDTAPKSEVYWAKAIEMLDKWSIPYIDLRKEATLISALDEIKSVYFAGDTWHLSSAGYDVITPKIEAWMKTL